MAPRRHHRLNWACRLVVWLSGCLVVCLRPVWLKERWKQGVTTGRHRLHRSPRHDSQRCGCMPTAGTAAEAPRGSAQLSSPRLLSSRLVSPTPTSNGRCYNTVRCTGRTAALQACDAGVHAVPVFISRPSTTRCQCSHRQARRLAAQY